MNAAMLYNAMMGNISYANRTRRSADAHSPQQNETYEANAVQHYVMLDAKNNLVQCDRRWAIANILHFFARTEQAGVLRKYNKHADKFLTGDVWHGAYGAIAMPQVELCINLLKQNIYSRRAVVSMGGLEYNDVNRPACWSLLHFMLNDGKLDLIVYQRSLSMRVFPYDCTLLTNVLRYVAGWCSRPMGSLQWLIGSLHTAEKPAEKHCAPNSLLLDIRMLRDPIRCYKELEDGLPNFSV